MPTNIFAASGRVARPGVSHGQEPLADDPLLVIGVRADLGLPAADIRSVVPPLRHGQLGAVDLVDAEITGLAGGRRAVADGVDAAGQLQEQWQMLGVVELVEERFAVRLDVHHHPEDVRSPAGELGAPADPVVYGEMT